VSFEIGFEGGVGVDRSKMSRRELHIEELHKNTSLS